MKNSGDEACDEAAGRWQQGGEEERRGEASWTVLAASSPRGDELLRHHHHHHHSQANPRRASPSLLGTQQITANSRTGSLFALPFQSHVSPAAAHVGVPTQTQKERSLCLVVYGLSTPDQRFRLYKVFELHFFFILHLFRVCLRFVYVLYSGKLLPVPHLLQKAPVEVIWVFNGIFTVLGTD